MDTKQDTTYNGWKNFETWNVALWIGNDEGLYEFSRECRTFERFVAGMRELGQTETPDGVAYNDSGLDTEALAAMMEEMYA
jgi:hypothetical protein